MSWKDGIVSDPAVLSGKPVVRGRRLSVDFVLGLLASGWTTDQILANYPGVTAEGLRAAFGHAAEALQDEWVYPLVRRAS